LASKDAGGFSDPICAVFGSSSTKPRAELGRTEYIMNSQNPQFKKKISLKYVPDDGQQLEFRLYDVDFLSGTEVISVIQKGMHKYSERTIFFLFLTGRIER
jgi:hypothetical protein